MLIAMSSAALTIGLIVAAVIGVIGAVVEMQRDRDIRAIRRHVERD